MADHLTSRYAVLSREELARLVPELLLIGQLIDRSGMAWCIAELGREGMVEIAVEEWMAASPIYTQRMQRALGYAPTSPDGLGDVVTIFKGLQLDIGAPPQFMDFRYRVDDARHGEFWLDHCGALMDVEPMGEAYVRSMCHDIEDPTFDATAVATHPRARVRPVHRPPRSPAGRTPHCAWTVVIDDDHPPVSESEGCRVLRGSEAARFELEPIDTSGEGRHDYAGPLLSDLDFAAFSHAALVRIADEVCLQMHLLDLAFVRAVRARLPEETAREVCVKQLTGIAGVAAERIRRCLDLPADADGALRTLSLHPLLNPRDYAATDTIADEVVVGGSAARRDGAWLALLGPDETRPLRAAVRAVDPHLDVEVDALCGGPGTWSFRVVRRDEPAPECDEVALTRVSSGATFAFEPRRSIPITPV